MEKLLLLSRRSRWQTTFVGLVVGMALFSATAFGQVADSLQKQMMPLANSVDGSKPILSQTAFMYQGQLKESGMPANGAYDVQFTLYTSQTGGNELGSVVHEDVAVINGQFTVKLDFGRGALDSKESWLEVAVRYGYSTEAYTALSPRQRLTPTPYAILAQRESWSLIGVPVGFAEGMSEAKTIDPLKGASGKAEAPDKQAETPGAEKTAAAVAQGAPDFVVKFDESGNPAASSIMFDNGANVGIGTTTPKGKLDITGSAPTNANTGQLRITETTSNNFMLLGRAAAYGFVQSHNSEPLALNPLGNNVGIGTTNPHFQLSLGSSLANTKLALYETGATNSYGLGVLPGSFRLHLSGSGARFAFLDSDEVDANEIVTIHGSGNVNITGRTRTGVLEITGGSDLAEPFEVGVGEAINPGMVVAIDPERPGRLRLANKAYDRAVAGIVSGANGINPGLTMKQEGAVTDGSLLVALTGRVYCWADASYGTIKPGHLLTTSATPGHAMRGANYSKSKGAILGKAMTSLTKGRGLVLVLVTLQ